MSIKQCKQISLSISDNAKRLQNVDAAKVVPMSSRLALAAKLAVEDGSAGVLAI